MTDKKAIDRMPAPNTAEAASLYQRLRGHLAVLKLHDAAEALPSVLDQAAAEDLSMTAALDRLLSIEVEATEVRRLTGRLRFACLPTPASLEDFDYDAAAGVDRKLIDELATCRYLETATNVLLIGPPGVGKTHLSVGLARAAAHAGYRTYFTTAADLAARCHRAALEGRWATTMRFYAGPTLLVIDELGYLPLPGEAASALFQVVSWAVYEDLDRDDDQPRRRIMGRSTRRQHRRSSHARPAPASLRRAQPRRRFLPPARPQRQIGEAPQDHHRNPPTTTVKTAHG